MLLLMGQNNVTDLQKCIIVTTCFIYGLKLNICNLSAVTPVHLGALKSSVNMEAMLKHRKKPKFKSVMLLSMGQDNVTNSDLQNCDHLLYMHIN